MLFGGHNGAESLSTIEEYDPATNTWVFKKPMPFKRSYIAPSAITYKDKIYIIGGWNDQVAVSEVNEYDPKNETWNKLPNLLRNSPDVFSDRKKCD